MFHRLWIQNFGLITELALSFSDGLIAFTGETGAGKSMILDAIQGALGQKVAEHGLKDGVIELEASVQGERTTLRYQCLNGKRTYWINGHKTKASVFRTHAEPLASVHGQHSHLLYLKPQRQRELIDEFAQNKAVREQVKAAYEVWEQQKHQWQILLDEQRERVARQDALKILLDDLADVAPRSGEWEELSLQQKSIAREDDRAALKTDLNAFLNEGSERDRGLLSQFHHWTQKAAQEAKYSPEFETIFQLLQEIDVSLSEVDRQLTHVSVETDREQALHCERRLGVLYDAARKWKVLPERLADFWQENQQQLATWGSMDSQVEDAKRACEQAESAYQALAEQLSQTRQKVQAPFAQAVEEAIQSLGMQGAHFEIQRQWKSQPGPSGQDEVVFCMSTIPGFPCAPMDEVVSGGELSRLALVFETLCAQHQPAETLIFDEADVGIGGKTAHLIGQWFQKLSLKKQVILVTHLPQIAARARLHFALAKKPVLGEDRLFLEVTELAEHALRVQEIARMLGDTDRASLEHAEVLLGAQIEIT